MVWGTVSGKYIVHACSRHVVWFVILPRLAAGRWAAVATTAAFHAWRPTSGGLGLPSCVPFHVGVQGFEHSQKTSLRCRFLFHMF